MWAAQDRLPDEAAALRLKRWALAEFDIEQGEGDRERHLDLEGLQDL